MQSKEKKWYRYFESYNGDTLLVVEGNKINNGKEPHVEVLAFDGTKMFLLCEGISSKKLEVYKEVTRDRFINELTNSYVRLKELYYNDLPF